MPCHEPFYTRLGPLTTCRARLEKSEQACQAAPALCPHTHAHAPTTHRHHSCHARIATIDSSMMGGAADEVAALPLLQLPAPFLLDCLRWLRADAEDSGFSSSNSGRAPLCLASRSLYSRCVIEVLGGGTLCLWGAPDAQRVDVCMRMGGVRTLMLPDSWERYQVPQDAELSCLRGLVVNYRCFRQKERGRAGSCTGQGE